MFWYLFIFLWSLAHFDILPKEFWDVFWIVIFVNSLALLLFSRETKTTEPEKHSVRPIKLLFL